VSKYSPQIVLIYGGVSNADFPASSGHYRRSSRPLKPFRYFNSALSHDAFGERTGTFCPHIEAITVIQDRRVLQINPDGIEERELLEGKSGRGSTVCITFHTEDGHRRYLLFQFHKGEVFEQLTELEPIPEWDAQPSELWRD